MTQEKCLKNSFVERRKYLRVKSLDFIVNGDIMQSYKAKVLCWNVEMSKTTVRRAEEKFQWNIKIMSKCSKILIDKRDSKH